MVEGYIIYCVPFSGGWITDFMVESIKAWPADIEGNKRMVEGLKNENGLMASAEKP